MLSKAHLSPPSPDELRKAVENSLPPGIYPKSLRVTGISRGEDGWHIAGFLQYHSSSKKANYLVDFQAVLDWSGKISLLIAGGQRYYQRQGPPRHTEKA